MIYNRQTVKLEALAQADEFLVEREECRHETNIDDDLYDDRFDDYDDDDDDYPDLTFFNRDPNEPDYDDDAAEKSDLDIGRENSYWDRYFEIACNHDSLRDWL